MLHTAIPFPFTKVVEKCLYVIFVCSSIYFQQLDPGRKNVPANYFIRATVIRAALTLRNVLFICILSHRYNSYKSRVYLGLFAFFSLREYWFFKCMYIGLIHAGFVDDIFMYENNWLMIIHFKSFHLRFNCA